MKSNYDNLGRHIRLINSRNDNNVTDKVLGISINKEFMPSVANVIGTDLSKYKLITKGKFACNPMHVGRDERLPVALYEEDEPAIVSPAYFMFEVIDNKILNEEYLMMWLRRAEFDRECWFHTDGSVRGGIVWDDLCRLKLPIPSIEKQKQIVADYKAITNRIKLKKQINDNLYQMIQHLRKYWFEEYIPFNGQRPSDWIETPLSNIADFVTGYSYSSNDLKNSNIAMATIKNFDKVNGFKLDGYKEIIPNKKVKPEQYANLFDVLVAHTDLTQGTIIGNAECILSTSQYNEIIFSMDLVKVVPKKATINTFFLAALLQDTKFKQHCLQYINGTTVMHLSKKALPTYSLYLPNDLSIFSHFNLELEKLYFSIAKNMKEIALLERIKTVLLSNISSC